MVKRKEKYLERKCFIEIQQDGKNGLLIGRSVSAGHQEKPGKISQRKKKVAKTKRSKTAEHSRGRMRVIKCQDKYKDQNQEREISQRRRKKGTEK